MQPQPHEVRVKNKECEREKQQRLVKQRKRIAILRNDHILTFGAVQNRGHIFNVSFAILLTHLRVRCTMDIIDS